MTLEQLTVDENFRENSEFIGAPDTGEHSISFGDVPTQAGLAGVLPNLPDVRSFGLGDIVETLKALFNSFAAPVMAEARPELQRAQQAPTQLNSVMPADEREIADQSSEASEPARSPQTLSLTPTGEPASTPSDATREAALTPQRDDLPLEGMQALLDQDRRDTDEPDPTFSEADNARAASFSAVAGHPGEGNERLERGNDIHGEWSIGPGYAAPLLELNGIEYTSMGKPVHDEDGDGVDDDDEEFADALDRITDQQRIQRERDETMSQEALDSMAWDGDPDATWNMNGISASRRTWYNAAKAARKSLPALAQQNGWSDDERADQEYWLSEYEKKIKENDQQGAKEIKDDHFKPELAHQVEVNAVQETNGAANVTGELEYSATRGGANATESATARTAALASMTDVNATSPSAVPQEMEVASSAFESALSNPPDISLNDHFTAAVSPPAEVAPVKLANAAAAPKAAAPALDQTLSL